MFKLASASIILGVGLLAAQVLHPLTSTQVEQLVGVLPDKALAREIRQRGIDFKVDRPTLERFKNISAGTETLAALAEMLSSAQLAVTSIPPNCDVELDGRVVGKTDDTGRLVIPELDGGRTALKISRDGYRSRSYDLQLAKNTMTELHAALDRVTGYLSVSVTPGDASLVIRPIESQPGANSGSLCHAAQATSNLWECVPGDYTVEASRNAFRSAVESARVLEGQTSSVSLTLLPSLPVAASTPTPPRELPQPATVASRRSGETKATEKTGALQLLAMVQSAMGGNERHASVRNWERRAKEIWEPGKGTAEVTTVFVAPSTLREETKGGNKTVNYSNGKTGWTWSSTQHVVRELPAATATGMVFRTLDNLIWSDADADRSVRLLAADRIVVSDRYGNTVNVTVDLRSNLPRRLTWRNLDGALLEEAYSDWREIGGVMWWFHMTRARNGTIFLEVQVKDYGINTGLTDHDINVSPEATAQQALHSHEFPAVTRLELKTDGDRRGTLVLFGDHIQYRDDGMGTGGGRAPYGPNPANNFALLCSEVVNVKSYGFRPTLFGSFQVVISARRSKFHIPALNSVSIAKVIRDRCGVNPSNDH